MTDQDENRPLSRRELRLREMAADGQQTEVPQAQPGSGYAPGDAEEAAEPEFDVEIPLLDENGNPRSRRELRELREQAIAELKAASAEADADASADAVDEATAGDLGFNPELAETVAFDVLADDTEVFESEQLAEEPTVAATSEETAFDALLQQATAEEAAFDEQETLADVPAESESVAEVLEESSEEVAAEMLPEPEVEVEVEVDSESGSDDAEPESDEAEPDTETDEAELKSGDAESDEAEPESDDTESDEAEPESDEAESESDDTESDEAEPELDDALTEADPEIEEDATSASEEVTSAPVAASVAQTYSFPDITPLDDGQSIFDDPAIQVIGGASAQAGAGIDNGHDFDELITRAVAQEGAASTTNTSALILPAMPEADALAGPIGETGELFITGSFDLPMSLSETGGHASLHDSVDAEPFDELGFVEPTATGAMAPVSASRAVSARANQGPLVAESTKDKNKMPVVLIATGGVLVLGATGLIIWAATSGLFG